MKFEKQIKRFLKKYGQNITVTVNGVSYVANALIEPLRYKNKLYLEAQRTELGFKDSECFLYIGPTEPDFVGNEELTLIESNKGNFSVSRADRVLLFGETQYIWAVLTSKVTEVAYEQ